MQKIYAHRGASGYAPENTLRAFALAADMGADGVELDVQISKDGRLVVFHDDELSRLTGFTGSVADYTYAELCRMPVIHAVDATERDVAPLLEDVLALLRERGLSVNIELKNSRAAFPALEEKTLEAVEKAGMREKTIYSSFNHYSLLKVRRLDPNAVCGLLYDAMLYQPWDYARQLGVQALHPHFSEPRTGWGFRSTCGRSTRKRICAGWQRWTATASFPTTRMWRCAFYGKCAADRRIEGMR